MDYAHVLFDRFALEYFRAGVQEVHLIFDKPGRQTFNPKQFEHAKRYTKGKSCNQHEHISFTPQTSIPQGWQEYLECRECKRSIVEAVGLSFLQKGQLVMGCQNLVIAGCLSQEGENNAWVIHSSEVIGTTGCDFVSYFKSLDKATILNIFFQHAEFICGPNMPGCL